jgi:hypothetical protein
MKFIATLVAQHLQRYPLMELADVYKLLHQAALGPGHAVDSLAAQKRLEHELAEAGTAPDEPEIDLISPNGKLARIHLRPYVRGGGDLKALSEAFVHTAENYPPSRDRLARFCGCLGDLAQSGSLPFTREQAIAYVAQMAAADYLAVHHSDGYRTAYRPAYRVVAIDLLPPND